MLWPRIQRSREAVRIDQAIAYYATAIGLAPADFQSLHDTALPCRSAVGSQDDAATLVIKDFRAKAAAAALRAPHCHPSKPNSRPCNSSGTRWCSDVWTN